MLCGFDEQQCAYKITKYLQTRCLCKITFTTVKESMLETCNLVKTSFNGHAWPLNMFCFDTGCFLRHKASSTVVIRAADRLKILIAINRTINNFNRD